MKYNFTHNSKQIILRINPLFEIILTEDSFEIINDSKKNNIYYFEKINSIELIKERIIWYLTIIDILLSLGPGSSFKGAVKEENEIKIFYENVPIRYSLKKCDLKKASEAVNEIKKRIEKATHNTS